MPFTFEDLDLPLQNKMRGNGVPMLKARQGTRGEMAGLSPINMPPGNRHPCMQMQWLEDNFPAYDFVGFVEVGGDFARQGLRALQRGTNTVAKEWVYEVRGGEDGDIYRQIPRNHVRMMREIMREVWEASERGDLVLGDQGGGPGGGPGGGQGGGNPNS